MRCVEPYCLTEAFACHDYSAADLDMGLRDLISGAVPAIRVSGFVSGADAEVLTRSFLLSPAVRERADGVSGKYLGAYHYRRTYEGYICQVGQTSAPLAEVLRSGGDPVARLNDVISHGLLTSSTAENRPAMWRGSEVAIARMSAWLPSADYLLQAHDDVGQLRDPAQAGFEPQQLPDRGVFAANIYTSSPTEGGKLRLWNVLSDGQMRNDLGITSSGYPYPSTFLATHDFIDIQPQTGDLVVINGAIPHAVTLCEADEPRVALNFFFGKLGESIIRWV